MDGKKLSDLTDEELVKESKSKENQVKVFCFFMCMWIAAAIYLATQKGIRGSTFLSLCFLPIGLNMYSSLKAAKAEIAARKLN